MTESSLTAAIREFDKVESNLVKAEKLIDFIKGLTPAGIDFSSSNEYARSCRDYEALANSLPLISGWRPDALPLDLEEIAQARLDAFEIGEIESQVAIEQRIDEPRKQLDRYRHEFDIARRKLVRVALNELIDKFDDDLRKLKPLLDTEHENPFDAPKPDLGPLQDHIQQLAVLLGSSAPNPPRWGDLHRHLRFGMLNDLYDIAVHDWPAIKKYILDNMYGERDAIPVNVLDLADLVTSKPSGQVATKLQWSQLTDENFERLIFALISGQESYENAEWLTHTNAADRGRDLSVCRVHRDPLSGTDRKRVIIQCKHWLSKSIGIESLSTLRDQMKLWEPPRVDVHIIATSGRFTADAVSFIERHNGSDSAMRIEMWPETHLELLLAARPHLTAQFGLR